ncbi:MAG: hypothetical protein SV062_04375 [Thermodesulfobacteriota bacterium]|nr:hypothetical protein [Thermodesulfobacteriota bacterium]
MSRLNLAGYRIKKAKKMELTDNNTKKDYLWGCRESLQMETATLPGL